MAFRLVGGDVLAKLMLKHRARLRDLTPATRRFGEFIANRARRAAPVGQGSNRGALKRSLRCEPTAHNVATLTSALAYAGVQQHGGTIRAGSGPLGSKLLAIPLNAEARKMLEGLGASRSLRDLNLLFIRTRTGRMLLIRKLPSARGRRRGAKRQHRMFSGQVLFVLVPRVTLRPNPEPHGYAPRVDDPEVQARGAALLRQHLRGEGG